MSAPDRQMHTFDVVSAHPEAAVAQIRRFLRGHGWARTHVLERAQSPSIKIAGSFDLHLVIETTGIRAAVVSEGAARHGPRDSEEWKRYEGRSLEEVRHTFNTSFDPRSFKVGSRVRTKAEGESFAKGQRHVMFVGAIGVVAGRDRISVRVRFDPAQPGRVFGPDKPQRAFTFAYAPGDLERLP